MVTPNICLAHVFHSYISNKTELRDGGTEHINSLTPVVHSEKMLPSSQLETSVKNDFCLEYMLRMTFRISVCGHCTKRLLCRT
jgi:hypothetical protein